MTPDAIRTHLLEELLPLWRRHGTDPGGAFFGRLLPDLRPAGDPFRRLLVQGRQIYVFSRAWLEGAPAWSLEVAQRGVAHLRSAFWDARHGGWYLATTPDGEPLDRRKDLYAQAFVLLGLAWHYRAVKVREILHLAEETLALLETHLADPVWGGFFEGASEDWVAEEESRRQNPHMHLFEALLALHESTEDARYLDAARRILRLLRERFMDPERGCLREHFTRRWDPQPGADGRVLEPGHHFEWTWLLRDYARLARDRSVLAEADALYAFALSHGVDPEYGGVFDQIDPDGAVLADTKRLWPQTEHIRALAAGVGSSERDDARERLDATLELCFTRYVDPSHRGWQEHARRDGTIFSRSMNATSVYHVWGALAEAARALAPGAGEGAAG